MFTLISSLTSPYGRKVRIVIDCLGQTHNMQLQHADVTDEKDPLRAINPLGKIPVLVPEDGSPIHDSRVIVEYLESTYGHGDIIPLEPGARFRELSLAATAEGINDTLLLIAYEKRFRSPEHRSPEWLERQQDKLRRALPHVIDQLSEFKGPGIAATTLACALGYADWRRQINWRKDYPELVSWLKIYAKAVPSFEQTIPPM